MKFNWFPGHMEKARQELETKLKIVDFVIELVDARIPFSSHNPLIEQIVQNKSKILIMTKLDLCDKSKVSIWKEYYQKLDYIVLEMNTLKFRNFKEITKKAESICKEKREKEKRKGIRPQPLKTMVVGVPNVGKSTFINYFSKRKITSVANKPGHTKRQQWVRLDKNIHLLDTPGILWPKIENETIALNLALSNSIKLDILPKEELVIKAFEFLNNNYNFELEKYFGKKTIEFSYQDMLEGLYEKYSFKLKPDKETIAINKFLNEIVNGNVGNFTFEVPSDFNE